MTPLSTLSKDMEAYTSGKISYQEFKRREGMRNAQALWPAIEALAKAGKWDEFCSKAQYNYDTMAAAFRFYYKDIPANLKRSFALSCYSHRGDLLSCCRKAVRGLDRNGINELPLQYAGKDEITVYRAGEEPIEKAKYRLSWTLSYDVAKKFLSGLNSSHAVAIYKAKIRPQDIIAYMDDREEQEVLQYRKVYDIEQIE